MRCNNLLQTTFTLNIIHLVVYGEPQTVEGNTEVNIDENGYLIYCLCMGMVLFASIVNKHVLYRLNSCFIWISTA